MLWLIASILQIAIGTHTPDPTRLNALAIPALGTVQAQHAVVPNARHASKPDRHPSKLFDGVTSESERFAMATAAAMLAGLVAGCALATARLSETGARRTACLISALVAALAVAWFASMASPRDDAPSARGGSARDAAGHAADARP